MSDDAEQLEDLLTFIRDARGFDFTGYKRSTLTRRIRKRMGEVGVAGFADYRDLLEADTHELQLLFDTVLINVTRFFRDPQSWERVQSDLVPDLVARTDADEGLRLWVAGCSSGEEAYTLAIIFAEVLGLDQFRQRVKVYATDVDEDALRTARHGIYTSHELEGLAAELRDRYFDRSGTSFEFRADLRRQVIFGKHDITRDAPISQLHLLSCRNTLMYFNAATQADIVDRFHFALVDDGYLVLGRAEMLLGDSDRFEPVDIAERVFRRRRGSGLNRRPTLLPAAREVAARSTLLRSRQLRDLAIDTASTAHIIVDVDGTLVMINNQARATFAMTSRDEGRPLRDLEISYRPVELRSLIEQAQTERRRVRLNAVERTLGIDAVQYLDLLIQPLITTDGDVLGVDVAFTDTTTLVTLQEEAKRSGEDLETAYEELQATNEELETTNEELHSTNEELETMNEELRTRSAELDETRRYLEGVVRSIPAGVVVLDAVLHVQLWNAGAEDLWGLREDEVRGEAFFGLDIGLPTGQLRNAVRSVLATATPQTLDLEAVNRRGRSIACTIECSPLGTDGQGLVLLMENRPHDDSPTSSTPGGQP